MAVTTQAQQRAKQRGGASMFPDSPVISRGAPQESCAGEWNREWAAMTAGPFQIQRIVRSACCLESRVGGRQV
jgi:hypothetical protein